MDIAKLLSAQKGENSEFRAAKNRFDFEKTVTLSAKLYGGIFK